MLEEYKDILTVKDVKKILGYSNNTIYKMLKNNEIKYKRQPKGKYLISKQSLIEYLNSEWYNDIYTSFELPVSK